MAPTTDQIPRENGPMAKPLDKGRAVRLAWRTPGGWHLARVGSIWARFLLLLAVTLLPMLGLLSWVYAQRYAARRSEELQANLEVARSVALAFRSFANDISRQELALGEAARRLGPGAAANSLLASSARAYPAVKGFHWVGPQGRVLASSDPRVVGSDISRSPYWRTVPAGETYVANLRRSDDTGEWGFAIRRGIAGPRGELAGTVSAYVVPQRLGEAGIGLCRPDQGGVSLVDRDGLLVFRNAPPAPYPIGDNWGKQYPAYMQAARGQESALFIADATMAGRRRLAAYAPVQGIGWAAGAGRPEDIALAPIRRALVSDALLFLLVDALALLVALLISRGMAGAIRRLAGDAERLGAGDLAHRAAAAGPSEVVAVAEAFNAMADGLATRTEELQSANEQLRMQQEELAAANRELLAQQEQLRESEETARRRAEELQTLMDLIPMAVWVAHDPQCHLITGNRAAGRFYEAGPDENVSAGPAMGGQQDTTRRFFRDGRELAPEELPMQVAVKTGTEVIDSELTVLRPSGREMAMLGSATPLFGPDGQVRGCVAAFTDITARKQTEERLRESEERLRLAQSAASVGIWDWHLDTGRVEWTPELERMYGYEAGTFPGGYTAFSDRVHPDDLAQTERIRDDAVKAHQPFDCDFRVLLPSGETRWVNGKGGAIYDAAGHPQRVFGVNVDITVRKQAEERTQALQEITAALTAAVTSEQIGEVVLREGMRAMGAKAASIGTLAADSQELDIRTSAGVEDEVMAEWQRYPLGKRTMLADAVRTRRTIVSSSLDGRETAYPDTFAAMIANGLVASAAAPLEVGERTLGGIIYLFGEARDFSDDDVAFLEAIAGQTAQALERTRLFEEAQRQAEELREADRRKNRYLAMLGHELRNPLATICGGVGIALMRAQGDPILKQVMEAADRQVRIMTRILNDLLDVARITRGQITLHPEAVEIASVVQAAVETVAPRIEARRHALHVSWPRESLQVEGDPVRLAQVFANLLDNAAKYTPEGGQILVSVAQEGEGVVTRVRDTGKGIGADFLPRVFDAFERGEHSMGDADYGLGLGLALVHELVELHGGEVEAHSEGPGKGSELVVRLPLLGAKGPGRTEVDGAVPAAGLRILVVDDNPDSAEVLGLTLEVDGHEVATATSGQEALQAAAGLRPQVVFLDLGMPGMDGYEVARRLRGNPDLDGVVLVAFTGFGHEADRQRTAEAGFDHHLVKPVQHEEIARVLRTIESGD